MKPRRIDLWQCPYCFECSHDYGAIEECIARGYNERYKVGQFVLGRSNYGWHDGDDQWIWRKWKNKRMPEGYEYNFLYVITKIEPAENHPHRPEYTLMTLAMSGKQGHQFDEKWDEEKADQKDGIFKIINPANVPDRLRRQSKKMIGLTYEVLHPQKK